MSSFLKISLTIFLFTCLYIASVRMDYFAAISDMEKLLYTEKEMAISLQKYIQKEEKRLVKVREMSKRFSDLHEAASNSSANDFLSNPLNAYLLIKRLTHDWKTMRKLVDDFANRGVLQHILLGALDLPGEADLEGTVYALMRLHQTYKLKVPELANGRIAGAKNSLGLSAEDCYELGKYYQKSQDFFLATQWYQEGLKKLEGEEVKTVSKSEILKTLANAAFLNSNSALAAQATMELIVEDPDSPDAFEDLAIYQNMINSESGTPAEKLHSAEEYEEIKAIYPEVADQLQEWKRYEALCREEKVKTDKELSKLDCYHTTNSNPFFLLQPTKVEVVSLSPKIVMFHDIVSHAEADYLTQLATPSLQRAKVQNTQTNELIEASYRTSKSAWLHEGSDPVVDRVNRRIQEITGLTVSTAEYLLVMNYGIGGHYEPHWDFSNEENPFSLLGTGNRLATLIFYLSDVGAGGGTVFPNIGVNLKPTKGSAAFWYNLFRNGTGDYRTKHAACPVLSGSKWVSNKWIHELGQAFRRPCSVNQEE